MGKRLVLSLHPLAAILAGIALLFILLPLSQSLSMWILGSIFHISQEEWMEVITSQTLHTDQQILAFKILLISTQLVAFAGVAWVVSYVTGSAKENLYLKKVSNWQILAVAGLFMMVSIPAMQSMSFDPESFRLPESMRTLEEWVKQTEQESENLLKSMLRSDWGLNLLVIALVPALAEELFFRGFLQKNLTRLMNPHVAIFTTAFIFSLIHLQFFGFIPRFLMGLFFGYCVHWTGSIFPSMLAHFTNNALNVFAAYGALNGSLNEDMVSSSYRYPTWLIVISFVGSLLLLIQLYRKTHPLPPASTF